MTSLRWPTCEKISKKSLENFNQCSYPQRDYGGIVRLDRNKVICYHSHCVTINAEFLNALYARVDQPQEVAFATRKCELGETSMRRTD